MAKGDKRRRRLEELGPLSESNAPLIDSFRRSLRASKKFSANTVLAYTADVEQLARSFAHNRSGPHSPGETPLAEITGVGLCEWLEDFADGDEDEPEWSPATINRKIASIRRFYHWLVTRSEEQELPNPATHLENARTGEHIPKFLEATDLKAIFQILADRSDGQLGPGVDGSTDTEMERHLALIDLVVAQMCYYWGLRISEAVGVHMDDVRLEATGDVTITVRRKGGKIRIFPSQPQMVPLIHRYLAFRPQIATRSATHRDFLFLYPPTGRPLTRQTAFHRLRAAAVAALGEKGHLVSPHWLRHSLARHLLDEGHDVRLVQEILQHERLDTTAIYLSARPGEVQQVLRQRDIEDAERARARQLDGRG